METPQKYTGLSPILCAKYKAQDFDEFEGLGMGDAEIKNNFRSMVLGFDYLFEHIIKHNSAAEQFFSKTFKTQGMRRSFYHYNKHVIEEIGSMLGSNYEIVREEDDHNTIIIPSPQEYFDDSMYLYNHFKTSCIGTLKKENIFEHNGEISHSFGKQCFEQGFYIKECPQNGNNSLFKLYHIRSGRCGQYDFDSGICYSFLYNITKNMRLFKWRDNSGTTTIGHNGRSKQYRNYFLNYSI